jgi:1-phosphofructokinase family hexose kinase
VIVCVSPSPSIDRLFEVERLRPGEIHRPTRFVRVPGGKGLNVARSAAALGAGVRAVALLGGHSGRWIAAELERIGLPLVASWSEGETRSCLSVADAESGSLTEFYEANEAVSAEEWKAFEGTVHDAVTSSAWTTISGSLPPGAPVEGYEKLVAASARVAVDTTELGAAQPSLVKVNAAEATALTELAVDSIGGAAEAAHTLRLRIGGDGHAAAVTFGRAGAVLVEPDGSTWQGSLSSEGRFPVGSGDAFLAGLVTALDDGRRWPVALAAALGAAAANAEVPGPGSLDGARARDLAELAVVEPVTTVKAQ